MSELKEVYELEIARNAEGSKLAYMSLKDGETGYRIAGPKAWGGSKKLEEIEIRQDDLVEFVMSYAPQALDEILRRAQPEASVDAKDAELFERLFDEYMTVMSSAYCQCDLNQELFEECMNAISAARQAKENGNG